MKNLVLTCLMVFGAIGFMNAQEDLSIDALKAMKAEKEAIAAAAQAEVDAIDKQIKEFPGWTYGGVGILGLDLNSNSNWFAIPAPNSQSNAYGISASAFANLNKEKFFWRNLLTANLRRTNTTLNTTFDDDVAGNKVKATNDALDITSLGGYKLAPKWAISAEGKYTSTILNLNKPGKLTLSAGATWLPIDNMVVVIHPIGYEKNWPGDLVSSLGAKVGVTYAANIIKGVSWSTNLSAFIPYGSGDATFNQHEVTNNFDRGDLRAEYDLSVVEDSSDAIALGAGDLFNWTWLNSFSTNIFKGIGVGFNIGLRQDKQIAGQGEFETYTKDKSTFDLSSIPDDLQVFYSLGLSYTL